MDCMCTPSGSYDSHRTRSAVGNEKTRGRAPLQRRPHVVRLSCECAEPETLFQNRRAQPLHTRAHHNLILHLSTLRPASHNLPRTANGQRAANKRRPHSYIRTACDRRPLFVGPACVDWCECSCRMRSSSGASHVRVVGCERSRCGRPLPYAPRWSPRFSRAICRAHSRSLGRRTVLVTTRKSTARGSGCNSP